MSFENFRPQDQEDPKPEPIRRVEDYVKQHNFDTREAEYEKSLEEKVRVMSNAEIEMALGELRDAYEHRFRGSEGRVLKKEKERRWQEGSWETFGEERKIEKDYDESRQYREATNKDLERALERMSKFNPGPDGVDREFERFDAELKKREAELRNLRSSFEELKGGGER